MTPFVPVSALRMAAALLLLLAPWAASSDSDWETQVDRDGLIVETREVAGSNYRAFRASITVPAPLDAVFARLTDVESYTDWFPDVIEARRLEGDADTWRQYIRTDLPWPVTDRDSIYVQRVSREAGRISIEVGVDPDAVPEVRKAVRVREAGGTWLLVATAAGTEIRWDFHLEPGGNIPSGLANARLVDTPQRALLALREYFEPAS